MRFPFFSPTPVSLSSLLVCCGLAVFLTAPIPGLAQACPCACAQPVEGVVGSDGLCQCSCETVPIPGINAETLSGPPKPPMAGGPPPTWTVEPAFADDWNGPFWDDWW